MAFQSQMISLMCFGQFTETRKKDQSYLIALKGLTIAVPVPKELFDNPPPYGTPGIVKGTLTTNDFNGRPSAKHLSWLPLTDESQWPSDGVLNRFEGLADISKDSFTSKIGEVVPYLRIDGMSFTYQYFPQSQEELDKFPTGEHLIYGALKVDQTQNQQFKVKSTIWHCIPLGIINPKRAKQQ